MQFLRLLPLILLSIASAGPTTRPSARVDDQNRQRVAALVREALHWLDQHQPSRAEQSLRQALELAPNNSTCLYNLACVEAAQGKASAAMEDLERATDAGFTDFTHLSHDAFLRPLHDLPAYRALLARRDEIRHKAAQRALAALKDRFGPSYTYEVDEEHKLLLAVGGTRPIAELKAALLTQAASQEQDLFEHPPDEFVRVVIPSAPDWPKVQGRHDVGGWYDDTTRVVLAKQPGPTLAHEFTHALHAADQRAVGQEHPVWLSEGLASLYERTRTDFSRDEDHGHLVPLDNPRLTHVRAAAKRQVLIPFDRLLRMTREEFTDRAALAYGESSSLLLYLYEQGLLRRFYDTYKSEYEADPTGRKALEKVCGGELHEIQSEWATWMLGRPVEH